MTTEMAVKKYNNAEQEAERLGVKTAWIWAKARAGQIPCARVGKYYFFTPEKTDAWISEHVKQSK
jgi:hypothetical protein